MDGVRKARVKTIHELEPLPLQMDLLKTNAKRFKRNLRFVGIGLSKIPSLLKWEQPSSTVLCALFYFGCVYFRCLTLGCVIMLIVVLMYLYSQQHYMMDLRFQPELDHQPTLKNKFGMVFDAARLVQNNCGDLADHQERFINLITWRVPKNSKSVLHLLIGVMLLLLICPFDMVVLVAQIVLGVQLWLLKLLFDQFPEMKKQHGDR